MDTSKKRIVYGKKSKGILNADGPANLGKLDVIFEQINGELYLINDKEFFCETKQVFVTHNYSEIDLSFTEHDLLVIEAVPTTQEWKEGDCRYVTTAQKTSLNTSRKAAVQIMSAPLPSANERLLFTESPPLTPLILVKHGEKIYGPFQTEVEIDTDGSSSVKLLNLDGAFPGKPGGPVGGLRTYKYADIENGVVHYDTNGERYSFFTKADIFNQIDCEYTDYASDEEIIKICSDLLKKANVKSFSKHEQMMFRMAVSKAKGIPSNASEQLNRFFSIASEADEKFESLDQALHDYLNSSKGTGLLSKHIEERKDQYLKQFRQDKEQQLRAELAILETEVDSLSKIQKNLENENQVAAERLQEKNFLLKDQQKTLFDEARNKERNELDSELQKTKEQLALLKEELGPYKSLSDIKAAVAREEGRRSFLTDEITTAKQEKISLDDELNKRTEDLRKKLIALRPYVETISGMVSPVEEEVIKLPHSNGRQFAPKDLIAERNLYIDQIRESLARQGRIYERDFIANLLVAVQQSFIVILSGLPGVGKTSLIKLLGKSKLLDSRLLNISVGRGWTSQRDLIGYFNPLSNRMVPAPTGFYNYIKSCQTEVCHSAPPLWVVLDEANLSAIEHYWAPFMGMADSESDRTLRVNENESPIQIPESLRFIGTINYDMTTEPLSPRLIDRAPIITLEPSYEEFEYDSKFEFDESLIQIPYSHASLDQMFNVDPTLDLEIERAAINDQMAFFQDVRNILMDSNIAYGKRCVISKRKEIAIEKYCLVAHPLMRSASNMRALDYALSQHVLPLIQGSGEGYCKRLEALLQILSPSEFKISHSILYRIVEAGKLDMHSFSYFS
ncbi:hypothetical protein JFT66_18655 [Pseudomonas sp. MF6755]|uniref:hypothetical protein n=1 Tax=Pseudomonas sp. MF6755 TaxID=2797530 RepID=UPI0018E8A1A2|nr:hypothetical protein [Pseudomonas sp. MF6755]MBJ2286178.1 hypothetical protein [Pseudomonas sp. MF6755]